MKLLASEVDYMLLETKTVIRETLLISLHKIGVIDMRVEEFLCFQNRVMFLRNLNFQVTAKLS